jgi:hypothetical protein
MSDNLQNALTELRENIQETKIAKVGKYVNKIYEKKGSLTSDDLVEFARPEDSPIHDCFIWDADYALEKLNKFIANQYIARIRVRFLDANEDEGKGARAFRSIDVKYLEDGEEKTKKGYVRIDDIYSDEDKRKQVVQDLLSRQEYWTEEAKEFKELDKVVNKKELERVVKSL